MTRTIDADALLEWLDTEERACTNRLFPERGLTDQQAIRVTLMRVLLVDVRAHILSLLESS